MIVSQWLEVTMLATANTGLMEPDVFYFASLPGDANGDGRVNSIDLNAWAVEQFTAVDMDSEADFDRNGYVDGSDFDIWQEYKFTQLIGSPLDAMPSGGIVPAGTQVTLTNRWARYDLLHDRRDRSLADADRLYASRAGGRRIAIPRADEQHVDGGMQGQHGHSIQS